VSAFAYAIIFEQEGRSVSGRGRHWMTRSEAFLYLWWMRALESWSRFDQRLEKAVSTFAEAMKQEQG
jgi:hypothetical protein